MLFATWAIRRLWLSSRAAGDPDGAAPVTRAARPHSPIGMRDDRDRTAVSHFLGTGTVDVQRSRLAQCLFRAGLGGPKSATETTSGLVMRGCEPERDLYLRADEFMTFVMGGR